MITDESGPKPCDPKAGNDDAALVSEIKRKLIERKQDWAREGRLLTGRPCDRAT